MSPFKIKSLAIVAILAACSPFILVLAVLCWLAWQFVNSAIALL